MKSLAPVLFFAYNRPEHTKEALIALKNNDLAQQSKLFIFIDGSKPNATKDDKSKIEEVVTIAQSQQWCGEVELLISDKNKGCKDSIISGISAKVNEYGKAIIVEDDIVTSTYFLSFMNKALEYYENIKTVFSIAGHTIPERKFQIPADYPYDVFAFPRSFIWGWAIWADRWNGIDWEMKNVPDLITNEHISKAFRRGGDDLEIYLKDQYEIGVDNWDIQVALSCFINHYVSIVPCKSYVNNIGLDGSGIHCSNLNSKMEHNLELCPPDPRLLDIIYEDDRIVNSLCNAFSRKKRPVFQKMINKISRTLTGRNIFKLKTRVYA